MEFTLKLENGYDLYTLYLILYNRKTESLQKISKHHQMIRLLEGNETNEYAIEQLKTEQHAVRLLHEEIEKINYFINQMLPMVDEVLGIKNN